MATLLNVLFAIAVFIYILYRFWKETDPPRPPRTHTVPKTFERY